MPGGRLTERERRKIALWLRDDLAYAEIARRLDRPTSTITREVQRNGGPIGYQADVAHHAAARRQRGRRAPLRPDDRTPTVHGRDTRTVLEYQEQLAAVFLQAGLPRLTARVLACVYTADAEGSTAADLARRLRVSPASISKAVTLLERQSQIRREPGPGRRDRFLVDDDVLYQSAMASAHATAHLGRLARRGVDVLGPDTPAGARLANTAREAEFIAERIAHAADEARDLIRTAPTGTATAAAPPAVGNAVAADP